MNPALQPIDIHVKVVKSIIKPWPSLWRHPIRHCRMKRAWKRHAKLMNTPIGRRLARMEDEAFLRGTGPL